MLEHLDKVNAVYGSATDLPTAASARYGGTSEDAVGALPASPLSPSPPPPTTLSQTLEFDEDDDDEEGNDKFVAFPATLEEGDENEEEDEDEDLFDAFDAHIPLMAPTRRDTNLGYSEGLEGGFRNVSMGRRRSSMLGRRESVGASQLSIMSLGGGDMVDEASNDEADNGNSNSNNNNDNDNDSRNIKAKLDEKRKRQSMAKHRRVSLCATALTGDPHRQSLLSNSRMSVSSSRFSLAGGNNNNNNRFSMTGAAASSRRNFMSTGLTSRFGMPVRMASVSTNDADDLVQAPTKCESPVTSSDGKKLDMEMDVIINVGVDVDVDVDLSTDPDNKLLPISARSQVINEVSERSERAL